MGWRFRIDLEYDGTGFSGWQVQPGRRTVQGELARALGRLGERTRPAGAGRTDAGVHALGNVAHVDLERDWEDGELLRALRGHSPPDLRITRAGRVEPEFHARFTALSRTYRYALGREADPFFRARRWVPRRFPDPGWAEGELAAITGERGFASLARSGSESRSMRCRIDRAAWTEVAGGAVVTVTADRFLYGMMRALVGTLVREAGARPPGGLVRVLEAQNRGAAGAAAPPGGLYLTAVAYPGETVPERLGRVLRLSGLGAAPGGPSPAGSLPERGE